VSSEPTIRLGRDDAEVSTRSITVAVRRRIPSDHGRPVERIDTYELHPAGPLNLLGVFREIYFHHDPTFGFRNFECGRGICSTCNVSFEGRVQKGCRIPVRDGSHIEIGPQNPDRSLRDIACRVGDETDTEPDD
jgi:succinate dehydrogenase/fumarate reductase-like Fe-S protein